MLTIDFPELPNKTRNTDRGQEIFDTIRKKWLLLTPEEWVRQNLVNWLVNSQNIPASFIALERTVLVFDQRKRFDIVVYGRNMQPWLLIECKAMDVPLTETVLQQALGYQAAIGTAIFAISNGHHTYAWQMVGNTIKMLESLPPFA